MIDGCRHLDFQRAFDLYLLSHNYAHEEMNNFVDVQYLVAGMGVALLAAYGISKIYRPLQGRVIPVEETLQALTEHKNCAKLPEGFDEIDENHTSNTYVLLDLIHFFIAQRDADQSPARSVFRALWQQRFDALDPEIQQKIILADMKEIAIEKGLRGNEIDQFVVARFANEELRNRSIHYVRNLGVLEYRHHSGQIIYFNPMDDDQVPRFLREIAAADLGKGIQRESSID